MLEANLECLFSIKMLSNESGKKRNIAKERLLNQGEKILSFLPLLKQAVNMNSCATTVC